MATELLRLLLLDRLHRAVESWASSEVLVLGLEAFVVSLHGFASPISPVGDVGVRFPACGRFACPLWPQSPSDVARSDRSPCSTHGAAAAPRGRSRPQGEPPQATGGATVRRAVAWSRGAPPSREGRHCDSDAPPRRRSTTGFHRHRSPRAPATRPRVGAGGGAVPTAPACWPRARRRPARLARPDRGIGRPAPGGRAARRRRPSPPDPLGVPGARRPARPRRVREASTTPPADPVWFAGELGGPTLRTTSSPSSSARAAGRRRGSRRTLAEGHRRAATCVPVQDDDPNFRWMVYADVPSACGDAIGSAGPADGVTIMGEQAHAGPGRRRRDHPIPAAPSATEPATRWVGRPRPRARATALGLPHPPGCDDGLLAACDAGRSCGRATSTGRSPPGRRRAGGPGGQPLPSACPAPGRPTSRPRSWRSTESRGGPDLRADQILVTWLAPFDDGGRPISAFRVTATPPLPSGPVLATAADRSVVLGGATGGTTYTVRVEALNAVGVGRPRPRRTP